MMKRWWTGSRPTKTLIILGGIHVLRSSMPDPTSPPPAFHPAYRQALAATAALTIVLIALHVLPSETQAALTYRRDAVRAGQWWRLISGGFIHLSWAHLWLNAGGALLVLGMFAPMLSLTRMVAQLVICAIATTTLLALFAPSVAWMVGLSGALHGLFAWCAGQLYAQADRDASGVWWRGPQIAIVLWLGLVIKLVAEWTTAQPGEVAWLGGAVLFPAHWAGAAFGAAMGLLTQTRRHQRT